jgi:hypothetical protein
MESNAFRQKRGQTGFNSGYHMTFLDSAELACLALQNLGFHVSLERNQITPPLSLQTIQTEALRAALWMHSAQGLQRVHINRLLRAAQRLMRPIWDHWGKTGSDYQLSRGMDDIDHLADESDGAHLDERLYELHRDALNELEMLGDVVELPYGYWQPAPLRAVQLPESKHWLLIGGIPTYRLSVPLRQHIKHQNFTRFLEHDPATYGLKCIRQSFEDWCDQLDESLKTWTKHILNQASLADCPAQEGEYALYMPAQKSFQRPLWLKKKAQMPDGRYFARTRLGLGSSY